MILKPNKQILELTNKFIEDFFILSEKLDDTKKADRGRNESYYFHYGLADAIGYCDYAVNKRVRQKDFPLITEGATMPGDRLALILFDQNIQGVINDIRFVIDNFNEQLNDDCEFVNLKKQKFGYTFWCYTQNVKIFCTITEFKTLELRLSPKKPAFHQVKMTATFDVGGMKLEQPKEHNEILYWSNYREVNEFYSCLSVVVSEIHDNLED